MRHPAAYPDMRNPGEVRAAMHSTYDRYIHGEDRFPRIRVIQPEVLPRKSVPIAQALFREWQVIDEDNRYFDDAIVVAMHALNARDKPQAGQVIAQVGRNAVNFAVISVPGSDQSGGQIIHGTQDTAAMVEMLNGLPLRMSDGRELQYTDGVLHPNPQPDMVVTRSSGQASVFYGEANPLAELFRNDPELLRLNQIVGERHL